MKFAHTERTLELIEKVKAFMDAHVYPVEKEVGQFYHNPDNLWKVSPIVEGLKEKAKEAGLWNLFLSKEYGDLGGGLTNLEYATLAEEMGKIVWAAEVFNCHAPDTGNMEVLAKYGSDELKEKYLTPLLDGKISSAFLMTEPDVASSDATNIETSIVKDGDEYVINGRKWFSSNAMHPNCEMFIVMGKTDPEAHMYEQQSMIVVPADAEGITIVRPLAILGNYSSPEGHAEVLLKNVRVPAANMLVGEGKGFEIAQGRLGPGRIHHCMRMIGMAQRSLELMCARVTQRTSFGNKLEKFSSIRFDVAKSRCEIEQARLLTLQAAYQIDELGVFGAMSSVSMIKIVCPQMLLNVVDRAIQAFGGMGLTQDTPFSQFYIYGRSLRFADGPDEVHMYQLGKYTVAKYRDTKIYADDEKGDVSFQ